MKKIPLLILAIFLLSCASPQTRMPGVDKSETEDEAKKQKMFLIDKYIADSGKVTNVATRIKVSGTKICEGNTSPMLGLTYWNMYDFSKEYQSLVAEKYKLGGALQVVNVGTSSPAEKAGFQFGDELAYIDENVIKGGKDAKKDFSKQLDEIVKANKPLKIKIWRSGQEKVLTITPVEACKSDISLTFDNSLNAFADGKNIFITKGMMNFFQSEEEMALVISHELAHNVMHHLDSKKTNATIGMVFGILLDIGAAAAGVNTQGEFTKAGGNIGAGAFSVDFEKEADYVGLYFMASANYKINDAALFWRRMAAENPSAITLSTTHPSTAERFVGIEKTVDEIKQKQINEKPLKPEIKIKAIDKVETADASESSEKSNILPSEYSEKTSQCKGGTMRACSAILLDASKDNSSVPRDAIDTAVTSFKASSALNDQDKLVFYDYSMSKLLKPEKETAQKFLAELLAKDSQQAKLRDSEDKLSNPFIAFQKEKKANYCNDVLKLNDAGFNSNEKDRHKKLVSKCSN